MSDGGERSFNENVIAEFRANGGRLGGMFAGKPLLLLTTRGARSGRPHTTPVVYLADGPRLLIFASNAGRPAHPQWYVNLLADPKVRVEVGEEAYDAVAREITGPERDELYARQVARDPAFGAYQEATDRVIPVVALERAP